VVLIDNRLFIDRTFDDSWIFDCFDHILDEVTDDWDEAYLSQKINKKRQENCGAENGAEAD